jgi:formiminoglutamase
MKNLVLFTDNDRKHLIKLRKGETKFGEHIQCLTDLKSIYEDILSLDVDYIVFGVAESIGVLANQGNPGTEKAWEATLKVLLNLQSNLFIKAERILILGHLDYSDVQNEWKEKRTPKDERLFKAKKQVESIDADVSHLVFLIVKAGKTPIIIGGGHNNAYGNIKGTSLALNQPINAVNFDAHHDFRAQEGRHSGNGFSYAHSDGFLKNYFIFGLHENYISQSDLETLNSTKTIAFNTFEALAIRRELKFKTELKTALKYVSNTRFGLEIDCDAIQNTPSSAMTPSGFSVNKARRFVSFMAKHKYASYLHICEAAPTKKSDTQVGKLISYIVTDFIKAQYDSRDNKL